MTDGQINYETYSDLELQEALSTIDPAAFPLNYRNLNAAIKSRRLTAPRTTGASASTQSDGTETTPAALELGALLLRLTPRTPVVYFVIAINVAVFAAMAWVGAGIMEPDVRIHIAWGSNLVPVTVDGEWWRLGTSVFLHFGLIHLLVNMWVLYANGRMVERLFGSARFAILYLFAGLTGSLASAAWNPAANSVGASGAIFGVLGGLAAFLFTKGARLPNAVVRQQAKSVVAFVLFSVINGITHDGIDNAAHLGGLLGGLLLGMVLARPLTEQARSEPQIRWLVVVVTGAALAVIAFGPIVVGARGRFTSEAGFSAAAVWFGYREPRILATYNGVVERAHAGKLSDEEFASQLGAEILPFYAKAQSLLAWKPMGDSKVDANRKLIARYVDLRAESMSMLQQALVAGDLDRATTAMKLQSEAEELARQLAAAGNSRGEEPTP